MKQKAALMTAVLCIVLFVGLWQSRKESTSENIDETVSVTGELKTTVLNVGKADCTIFETKDSVVMIDTGLKDTADEVIAYLSENKITKIDCLILTHFDKDHVGGAAKVMKAVTVEQVIQPDYGLAKKDSKAYNKYVETAAEQNIPVTTLEEKTKYTWGGASYTIYPPMEEYYGADEENDFSLVTEIQYGKTRMLFTGDAETKRLRELYSQITNWKFDVVKIPHHGVYQDGVDRFVNSVNAEYAIICCSKEETADEKTLEALERMETKTYLTQDGTVVFKTDGKTVSLRQE